MTEKFMFRREAGYTSGASAEWGIRRADGKPWRTAPSAEGKLDYYQAGDEVSSGGEVFYCNDLFDAVGGMLSQREDDDVPHPGAAVVVRRLFQRGPDGQWDYWFSDVEPDELLRQVTSIIHHATRLIPQLATALTEVEAEARRLGRPDRFRAARPPTGGTSMTTVIEAQHPGFCPVCEETFPAGTRVTKHEGGWGHVQCPQPRPVCGVCFMERALNGACGCEVM